VNIVFLVCQVLDNIIIIIIIIVIIIIMVLFVLQHEGRIA